MERRERVLQALNLEKPDRVPTHVIVIDGNNVDEVLGTHATDDFQLLRTIIADNPDDWAGQLNKMIPGIETTVFSRVTEASIGIGLDSTQIGLIPYFFTNDFDNAGIPFMKDIFGRVWQLKNNNGNFYPDYIRGTMNSEEKWKDLKDDLEGDLIKKYSKIGRRFFKSIHRKHKDEIFIMGTTDFAGIFESSWEGMGMGFFAKQLVKNPSFIKDVFDTYADFIIELNNSYIDAGAEVVVEAGDLAYKGRPMMSPRHFNELLLPAYKKLVDAVHDRGKNIVLHTDGYITPLLDFIVDAGFDGLHSLEPTAGVDLGLVKKKVKDNLCLLGNIDVSQVLVDGTKEDVDRAVKTAIKQGGKDGGFIISPANMHPRVRVQNLKWMVESTKKYGKY